LGFPGLNKFQHPALQVELALQPDEAGDRSTSIRHHDFTSSRCSPQILAQPGLEPSDGHPFLNQKTSEIIII
jgi:hypothetical protein